MLKNPTPGPRRKHHTIYGRWNPRYVRPYTVNTPSVIQDLEDIRKESVREALRALKVKISETSSRAQG